MRQTYRNIFYSAVCGGLTLPWSTGCARCQMPSSYPATGALAPTYSSDCVAPTVVVRRPPSPAPVIRPSESVSRTTVPPAAPPPAVADPPREVASPLPIAEVPAPLHPADDALAAWLEGGADVERDAYAHVTTIDASGTTLGDRELRTLSAFPHLRHLNLRGTGVTDAGLSALRSVPHLEFLGLSQTAVTDAGVAHLTGLSDLRYLTLADTAITDAAVFSLVELETLSGLNLKGTRLTRNGLAALRERFPDCKIVVDDALLTVAPRYQRERIPVSSRSPRLLAPGDVLSGPADQFVVPVLGETSPAERLAQILEEHIHDPRLLTAIGDLYRERGELGAALSAYREAAQLAPQDRDVQYRLGVALAEAGEIEAARQHLAAGLGPLVGDYNLAVILYRQGRIDESRAAVRAALERDATFVPARELWATLAQTGSTQVHTPETVAPSPTLQLLLEALQVTPQAGSTWQVAIQPAQPAARPETEFVTGAAVRAAAISPAVLISESPR